MARFVAEYRKIRYLDVEIIAKNREDAWEQVNEMESEIPEGFELDYLSGPFPERKGLTF